MTKTEALYNFWKGFGIDAYPSNAIPDDVYLPFLTFEKRIDESAETTIHLYYHTESEKIPDAKAEEISSSLMSGKIVKYDGGAFVINISSPAWYSVADQSDADMKHRIINTTVSDLTIF